MSEFSFYPFSISLLFAADEREMKTEAMANISQSVAWKSAASIFRFDMMPYAIDNMTEFEARIKPKIDRGLTFTRKMIEIIGSELWFFLNRVLAGATPR